jgi:hypothetical protein
VTTPANVPLAVTRGDSADLYLGIGRNGTRINLTGATVTGQVRATVDDATVMATFTCTLANQTTDAGGVLCRLSPADTATMTNGVYDIQIDFANGDRSTVVGGPVTVNKDVTRP